MVNLSMKRTDGLTPDFGSILGSGTLHPFIQPTRVRYASHTLGTVSIVQLEQIGLDQLKVLEEESRLEQASLEATWLDILRTTQAGACVDPVWARKVRYKMGCVEQFMTSVSREIKHRNHPDTQFLERFMNLLAKEYGKHDIDALAAEAA